MGKENDPSGNFGPGNYVTDLGKFGLDNTARLDLYEEQHVLDENYLDAISADTNNDPTDLPGPERPVIPEITEDMSY